MKRIIKRYGNRKLYDTEAKAYVSLAAIADMVRQGETVKVVDKESEEDLTAQTLMQIVLEEGKKGNSIIPTEILHNLLRRSGEALDGGIGQIREGVDKLVHSSLERLGEFVATPRTSELNKLRSQLGNLEEMLARLLDSEKGTNENETSEKERKQ